jgi:TPR repeat protein
MGDIASARLSFKRAANVGAAQAALELGMTFDAVILAQRGALSIVPDVSQARAWYDMAIKLGSTEASLTRSGNA